MGLFDRFKKKPASAAQPPASNPAESDPGIEIAEESTPKPAPAPAKTAPVAPKPATAQAAKPAAPATRPAPVARAAGGSAAGVKPPAAGAPASAVKPPTPASAPKPAASAAAKPAAPVAKAPTQTGMKPVAAPAAKPATSAAPGAPKAQTARPAAASAESAASGSKAGAPAIKSPATRPPAAAAAADSAASGSKAGIPAVKAPAARPVVKPAAAEASKPAPTTPPAPVAAPAAVAPAPKADPMVIPITSSTSAFSATQVGDKASKPVINVPQAAFSAREVATVPNLVNGVTSESLRDMLIAAVAANDGNLLYTLSIAHRQAILDNFAEWQKPPEVVRKDNQAMQMYASTLINLAQLFRDKFQDMTLAQKLSGPPKEPAQIQWEQAIQQAEALAKEVKLDEAKTLLQQLLAVIQAMPIDGPVPYHAVTHGRLAHLLLAKGEVDAAYPHMLISLRHCQQRKDDAGIQAASRGLYEICRYLGKTSEAADLADQLSAHYASLNNESDSKWWTKQAARVRASEPPVRIVFFMNDTQFEVDDVPQLQQGAVRYGFVRNRPPIALCDAYVQRGIQSGVNAKFDEAIEHFRTAGKIDPFDPSNHYQAALALMHMKRPADAVAEFDATEQRAPGWFNCRADRWLANEIAAGRLSSDLFFVLRTEEMPDQSATWDQKLELVNKNIAGVGPLPQLMLYKAHCLMRLNRIPEAEPVLRAALPVAVEPDIRTRILADLQMVLQDPEEKRRVLKEAIALNGNLAAAAVAKVTLAHLEQLIAQPT